MFTVGRRGLAFILCVLLGVIGVHRMYVGRWKSGMIMLCGTVFYSLSAIVIVRFLQNGVDQAETPLVLIKVVSFLFYGVLALLMFDLVQIIIGKFKDKSGDRLTDW